MEITLEQGTVAIGGAVRTRETLTGTICPQLPHDYWKNSRRANTAGVVIGLFCKTTATVWVKHLDNTMAPYAYFNELIPGAKLTPLPPQP